MPKYIKLTDAQDVTESVLLRKYGAQAFYFTRCAIDNLPTVKITSCENCKHWARNPWLFNETDYHGCGKLGVATHKDFFCASCDAGEDEDE